MTGIEDLQQRVAAVERQFGLAHEQRTKYSARLLGLMEAVETRLREQQDEMGRQADALARREAEVAEQTARAERGERDNEQLRGMLHSLLQAIEAGSRDVLSEAMQALEAKVASLVAGAPDAAGPQADAEPLVPDTEAVANESAAPVDEPADDAADLDAPIADEPAVIVHEAGADDPLVVVHEDAAPETLDAPADQGVTLAAIMQRVSKLVDEDGEVAASEEAPAEPAAEVEVAQAASKQAAGNA